MNSVGRALASWSTPQGGYFVFSGTPPGPWPTASWRSPKVAGVALTPAGATFPDGRSGEPQTSASRRPRPPVEEVRQAMGGGGALRQNSPRRNGDAERRG